MKKLREAVKPITMFPDIDRLIDRIVKSKKYKGAIKLYLQYKRDKKFGSDDMHTMLKVAKITGVDYRNLNKVFHDAVNKGAIPKQFAFDMALQEEQMKYTAKDDIFILDVESETEDEGEVFITRSELGDPDYSKGEVIDQEEFEDVFSGLDDEEVKQLFIIGDVKEDYNDADIIYTSNGKHRYGKDDPEDNISEAKLSYADFMKDGEEKNKTQWTVHFKQGRNIGSMPYGSYDETDPKKVIKMFQNSERGKKVTKLTRLK